MRHSAKIGLLTFAIGLTKGIGIPDGMKAEHAAAIAHSIRRGLDNHYRQVGSGKPSRAAHYKRLAKKRQNVRARRKK